MLACLSCTVSPTFETCPGLHVSPSDLLLTFSPTSLFWICMLVDLFVQRLPVLRCDRLNPFIWFLVYFWSLPLRTACGSWPFLYSVKSVDPYGSWLSPAFWSTRWAPSLSWVCRSTLWAPGYSRNFSTLLSALVLLTLPQGCTHYFFIVDLALVRSLEKNRHCFP